MTHRVIRCSVWACAVCETPFTLSVPPAIDDLVFCPWCGITCRALKGIRGAVVALTAAQVRQRQDRSLLTYFQAIRAETEASAVVPGSEAGEGLVPVKGGALRSIMDLEVARSCYEGDGEELFGYEYDTWLDPEGSDQ